MSSNNKSIKNKINIIPATIADYPIIQNMARFYVYELSRSCGSISDEWAIPEDGLYESFDFKNYFEDSSRKAFLVKVDNKLAGFILLNKHTMSPETDYNMGEFFILAKFQGIGVGSKAAQEIWNIHPGQWEVSVIPENKHALSFWRKTITNYVNGNYLEEIISIDYDKYQPKRHILKFSTNNKQV